MQVCTLLQTDNHAAPLSFYRPDALPAAQPTASKHWYVIVDMPSRAGLYRSFSVDPRVRHTFWTQTVGFGSVYVGVFSSNQMMVQRYMAVSSVRQAQAYVRHCR